VGRISQGVIRRQRLSAENDVGGMLGRLMFGDAIAERRQVDAGEHRFALPEHDRGQGEMQFIDQPGAKILTHRLDATADLHVATFGGLFRLFQRRLDTAGHEDEGVDEIRHRSELVIAMPAGKRRHEGVLDRE
jgi:hypothetical protein